MDYENSIEKKISDAAQRVCLRPVGRMEALLSSDLLDSIARIELALELEDLFAIKITTAEINFENFENISLIASFIETKIQLASN